MKTRIQQGFTLIELLVVITIIAILAGMALPAFTKIQERGYITKGISNGKQVATYLKIYASDNNGSYPDTVVTTATTANKAFREMFIATIADTETVFGCPSSDYGKPDGNIGSASDSFAAALVTKENHWEMAGGISDSLGNCPLIWECSVSEAWDPTFDPSLVGKPTKGRTWSGGKVIIGMNDGSVLTYAVPAGSSAGKIKPSGSASTNIFSGVTSAPTVLKVE
ncbi:MAG: type II secretion system GspH family protein [Verrucomicrobia bacterium]|nr:type II secretion system GspH family protein [Verrucomicrobiota bacterium]